MPFQPGYRRTVEEDVLAREGGESTLLHLQLNHPRRMLHNLNRWNKHQGVHGREKLVWNDILSN